jgi:predicted DNA-binding transcriptional regulator YafY
LGLFWGKNPSPSALVSAIASGDVKVDTGEVVKAAQVAAMKQAVEDLMDAGHIEEARSVITLLLEHGELEPPLRQELLKQSSQPLKGFRAEIGELIDNHQPFRLIYKTPGGEVQEFVASYAEVTFYEKRFYLQIWAEEVPESPDIPELQHNRCLRLDRIEGILPVSGNWRGHFDSIDVQMRLFGGLARAYEPKSEDIADDAGTEERNVTRKIVNLFWFIREIRRYGPDCVVIGPETVAEQVIKDYETTLKRYRELPTLRT